MSTITFDTYGFIKRLKEAGVDEKIAEAEALAVRESVTEAVQFVRDDMKISELLTKQEFELKIARLKNEIILWVIGIATTYGLGLLAVLAKGFHWL